MLASSPNASAAGNLDGFEIQIISYDAENVAPGQSFDLNVRLYKPREVSVSGGTIYAYLYGYEDNEKTIYNLGGEKSLGSAQASLFESKWGTYDSVEKAYSWTISVSEDTPTDNLLNLRATLKSDLKDIKIKDNNRVYTGENLGNYVKEEYSVDPKDPRWHLVQDYDPSIAINLTPVEWDPYLSVEQTKYDIPIHSEKEEGGFFSPIYLVVPGIILILFSIFYKTRSWKEERQGHF